MNACCVSQRDNTCGLEVTCKGFVRPTNFNRVHNKRPPSFCGTSVNKAMPNQRRGRIGGQTGGFGNLPDDLLHMIGEQASMQELARMQNLSRRHRGIAAPIMERRFEGAVMRGSPTRPATPQRPGFREVRPFYQSPSGLTETLAMIQNEFPAEWKKLHWRWDLSDYVADWLERNMEWAHYSWDDEYEAGEEPIDKSHSGLFVNAFADATGTDRDTLTREVITQLYIRMRNGDSALLKEHLPLPTSMSNRSLFGLYRNIMLAVYEDEFEDFIRKPGVLSHWLHILDFLLRDAGILTASNEKIPNVHLAHQSQFTSSCVTTGIAGTRRQIEHKTSCLSSFLSHDVNQALLR